MRKKAIIFIFFIIIIGVILNYPIFAQSPCGPSASPRAEGLVSAPSADPATNKFYTTGKCVVDPKATFTPFKIPSYDDLKSLYFNQSKVANKVDNITTMPNPILDGRLYRTAASTNLTSSGITGYTVTAVFFVEGNLTINGNITTSGNYGLVFVVKGDVVIDSAVTRIDAVLISGGKIYTGVIPPATTCSQNSTTGANQLVVYGSLISLNQTDTTPLKFCRSLSDNQNPAEVVNYQPKYLYILKDLFANTYQKWSEIQ